MKNIRYDIICYTRAAQSVMVYDIEEFFGMDHHYEDISEWDLLASTVGFGQYSGFGDGAMNDFEIAISSIKVSINDSIEEIIKGDSVDKTR